MMLIWTALAYFLFFGSSGSSDSKPRLTFVPREDLELTLSGTSKGCGDGNKLAICVSTHKTSSTATRNSSIWPAPWTWWPHHAKATITKIRPVGPVRVTNNQSAVVKSIRGSGHTSVSDFRPSGCIPFHQDLHANAYSLLFLIGGITLNLRPLFSHQATSSGRPVVDKF